MNQFKKRMLVLVLASVVSVAGACGAESYKNTLMSLDIDSSKDDAASLTLYTKQNYTNQITVSGKAAGTYVILLSETDGREAKIPEASGNIQSVTVNTIPYTSSGKGYTKITVKTNPNVKITAKKALYVNKEPKSEEKFIEEETTPEDYTGSTESQKQTNTPETKEAKSENIKKTDKPFEPINVQPEQTQVSSQNKKVTTPAPVQQNNPQEPEEEFDYMLLVYAFLIIVGVCAFIIMRSSSRMSEVVGGNDEFSFDDEEKPKKQSKGKKIKQTINKLDKMYEKPFKMPVNIAPTEDMPEISDVQTSEFVQEKETDIIDLDELFQQQKEAEEENNDALDDFLSAFSFDNSEAISVEQEEDALINEMYEKYIENGKVHFSDSDVEKINELLNSEINDETLKNIEQYAVSNPIQPKKPTPAERLEGYITSYVVAQNLSFTKDDVDALRKLISVEIDQDFVKDLTTNPERTEQMRKEIESRQISHKNREMLTLNVKDMLPDLSEALRKQGNKRIESEVKPQVVYYSEGYDVSTLSVSDELPNLVLDFDNAEYNKYRPSDDPDIAETGYDVETLSIKDELPDLDDALKNPDKYVEKKVHAVADEEELLKRISNVTFKPFYDGNENIRIYNDFEEERFIDLDAAKKDESAPEVSEEINTDEELEVLFKEEAEQVQETQEPENIIPQELPKLNKNTVAHTDKDENTQELMELIKSQQDERKQRLERMKQEHELKRKSVSKTEDNAGTFPKTCTVEGEKYEIISASKIADNIGCYLAKNEKGYEILGYVGDKIIKVKYYEKIQSKRIQTRLNEKFENGKAQYLVRLGLNKFVLNVTGDNMEYVMDLC